VHKDLRVLKGLLDRKELKDHKVLRAKLDPKEHKVSLDHKALLEAKVQLAVRARLDLLLVPLIKLFTKMVQTLQQVVQTSHLMEQH
jgi:hypothetical protein